MPLTKATYSMVQGAPVNVLDYGADPTGATSSLQAFKDAVSDAAGRSMYIPAGTYLIDGRVDFSAIYLAGFIVYGDGEGTEINCVGATAGFYFTYSGGGRDDHIIRIVEKMFFSGDRTSGQKLINCDNSAFVMIRDVVFYAGDVGYYQYGFVTALQGCHFRNNVTAGVQLNNCTTTAIRDCYFRGA